MYLAAPALDGLRPCFLRGGSPGGDALAVVDVHEPSEQRSSVRLVGPPLRVVARESLMVTHRVRVSPAQLRAELRVLGDEPVHGLARLRVPFLQQGDVLFRGQLAPQS